MVMVPTIQVPVAAPFSAGVGVEVQVGESSAGCVEVPVGGEMRRRWNPTEADKYMLEMSHSQNAFPSAPMRNELAHRLGIEPRQVQVWFQNRRQKERAKSSKDKAAGEATSEKAVGTHAKACAALGRPAPLRESVSPPPSTTSDVPHSPSPLSLPTLPPPLAAPPLPPMLNPLSLPTHHQPPLGLYAPPLPPNPYAAFGNCASFLALQQLPQTHQLMFRTDNRFAAEPGPAMISAPFKPTPDGAMAIAGGRAAFPEQRTVERPAVCHDPFMTASELTLRAALGHPNHIWGLTRHSGEPGPTRHSPGAKAVQLPPDRSVPSSDSTRSTHSPVSESRGIRKKNPPANRLLGVVRHLHTRPHCPASALEQALMLATASPHARHSKPSCALRPPAPRTDCSSACVSRLPSQWTDGPSQWRRSRSSRAASPEAGYRVQARPRSYARSTIVASHEAGYRVQARSRSSLVAPPDALTLRAPP